MKTNWETFSTGFGQFYQTWIAPILEALKVAFGVVKDVVVAVFQNGIVPAFQLVGTVIQTVWTTVIQPVWELIKLGAQIMGQVLQFVFQGIIVPAFQFCLLYTSPSPRDS